MIQDLHSHTYYSFCGADAPETVVEAAIAGGVELFGISDHNYGIALQRNETTFSNEAIRIMDYQRSLNAYLSHMRLVAERYREQLTMLCGIEIGTENLPFVLLPDGVDVSGFDYCLIEHIDSPGTTATDIFAFAARCGCKHVGIAHMDLFAYIDRIGADAEDFLRRMAASGMFWELNVNYDSIHGYREHAYVKRFLEDPAQQEIIRQSGVELSVGFDGHRVGDYRPERVRECCRRLDELELKTVFAK